MASSMKVLITGGAGFIGSHLAKNLAASGHEVTLLDSFSPQIHSDPEATQKRLKMVGHVVVGDVADRELMHRHLEAKDVVVHLAAETGTGQSMYDIMRHERTNVQGTAVLADYLVNNTASKIRKIVVASSRAVYGEGSYECSAHGAFHPEGRGDADMAAGQFDPMCPVCARPMFCVPTPESAPVLPTSFYGVTKYTQERMLLVFARSLGIDAFALRYQNVYGPGQSLSNPYTGILAIFSGLARAGKTINIFEDGMESRDFVYIEDVVDATAQCIEAPMMGDAVALNIGSGIGTTVLDVANRINGFFGGRSPVKVTGAYRKGDIRHNIAALNAAHRALGFTPRWAFSDGLAKFLEWAGTSEEDSVAGYERSLTEMARLGLFVEGRSR